MSNDDELRKRAKDELRKRVHEELAERVRAAFNDDRLHQIALRVASLTNAGEVRRVLYEECESVLAEIGLDKASVAAMARDVAVNDALGILRRLVKDLPE